MGYKLSQTGIKPINSKVQAITEKLTPKSLKELRSYLGAVNQLNRFIPNLAQLCHELRPLLKKDQPWNWGEKHDKAFKQINEKVKEVAEVGHFKRSSPIRIICDASKAGLGAVLQQTDDNNENNWRPIHFASRFLTPLESKYSINELELLAIVWAIEHFKNYLYGTKFQIISDHKALASVLKGNKNNKTYSSRLTRWVDRLLPFEFEIAHAPGRTMGIADYLSRHPSPIEGESVKATELWNTWFTVNHVNNMNAVLENEFNQPIRGRRWLKLQRSDERSKSAHWPIQRKQTNARENANYENSTATNKMGQAYSADELTGSEIYQVSSKFQPKLKFANQIGQNLLAANYLDDEFLQKVIGIVKNPTKGKIKALDSPWRERFQALSLDENKLLYLDDRLVIPKILQAPIKNSLHWGHPGRDAMLQQISDIWWPRIHRDITLLATNCPNCQEAGKSIKPILKQSNFGKIPTPEETNEQIAIDFAGPFKIAKSSKRYLIVSVDSKTGWQDAKFLRAPTTRKVNEFLQRYIADNGIPKQVRTDPGTAFTSDKFKEFCEKYFIKHITCPVNDHKGNGKVERLIRTINERMRANKNIILEKDNTGLSEMLYALRGAKRQNKPCAAELHNNRKYTTVKDIITTKPRNNYNVSDNDNNFQLEMSDFPGEQDSEILVRERARGTKLDGLYKKKKGVITKETDHTITVSGKKRRPTIYSKRDVARPDTNEVRTAANQEATTSQPITDAQQNRRTPSNDNERIKNAAPNKKPQPTKVNEKKKKSKFPKEFQRLQNWQQFLETDSTDEEEERRQQKAPIKATTSWEKQPKEEPKSEEETASQQSSDRPRRERKTPNYFGNPVMICGVEKEQNPEIITISSSTDDN